MLQQTQAEKTYDREKLMQLKINSKKSIQKNIEKYGKQENIIIKVLDIINGDQKQEMFKRRDQELEEDLKVVETQWTQKKNQLDTYKRLKENFNDFDYFAENAFF